MGKNNACMLKCQTKEHRTFAGFLSTHKLTCNARFTFCRERETSHRMFHFTWHAGSS